MVATAGRRSLATVGTVGDQALGLWGFGLPVREAAPADVAPPGPAVPVVQAGGGNPLLHAGPERSPCTSKSSTPATPAPTAAMAPAPASSVDPPLARGTRAHPRDRPTLQPAHQHHPSRATSSDALLRGRCALPGLCLKDDETFDDVGGGGGDACPTRAPRQARPRQRLPPESAGDHRTRSGPTTTPCCAPTEQRDVRLARRQPLLRPRRHRGVVGPYIRPGAYFLALKLRPGESAGDLQPVVLRYRSDLPMIPIVLTQVAAAAGHGRPGVDARPGPAPSPATTATRSSTTRRSTGSAAAPTTTT